VAGAVLRVAALPGTAVAGIDPTGAAPGVVGADGVPVGTIGAPVASTVPPVEVTSNATSVEPEAWTGALRAKVATIAQVAAMLRPPANARDAGATGPFLAFAWRFAAERTGVGLTVEVSDCSVIVVILFFFFFVFVLVVVVRVVVFVIRVVVIITRTRGNRRDWSGRFSSRRASHRRRRNRGWIARSDLESTANAGEPLR